MTCCRRGVSGVSASGGERGQCFPGSCESEPLGRCVWEDGCGHLQRRMPGTASRDPAFGQIALRRCVGRSDTDDCRSLKLGNRAENQTLEVSAGCVCG